MKSLSKILLMAALLSSTGITKAIPFKTITVNIPAFETQDRHLSGFNAVDLGGSFDVYITQGNSESVKVEAPADVIDRITTKVENGVLKLSTKRNTDWNWGGHEHMVIYVTARNINSINLSGSGDIFFKGGIHTNKLRLDISGSGDITGQVEAQTLESNISGSGDIKLNGHAGTSSIDISGNGDYSAASLPTNETSVNISGSGDVRINVTNSIKASISGSGDIYYTGNAKHIHTSNNGSGEIHHI